MQIGVFCEDYILLFWTLFKKTIHFLKSKPDEAFAVFHKYCHILKWDKVLTFIQKRLEEVDGTNLVLQQPNGNRNLIQSNRQSTSGTC